MGVLDFQSDVECFLVVILCAFGFFHKMLLCFFVILSYNVKDKGVSVSNRCIKKVSRNAVGCREIAWQPLRLQRIWYN